MKIINEYALFAPLLSYILWVVILYVLLTIIRAPNIWGTVESPDDCHPFFNLEKSTSANLSNQFEWPVLFYVICIIVIARPDLYQNAYLWAAWVFVIGRVVHSIVQIVSTNIRLRGSVFNINFLAVLFMWGILALDTLSR
jgi:hypothetical protein